MRSAMSDNIEEIKRIRDIGFSNLDQQCRTLGLRLEKMNWTKQCAPEQFVLDKKINDGYAGSRYEGRAIAIAVNALCLNQLTIASPFQSTKQAAREDACVRGISILASFDANQMDSLANSIQCITKNEYMCNCQEILGHSFVIEQCPDISPTLLECIYDSLSKERFIKIARMFAADHKYRNGWPDVTIIKNGEIELIEVKTSDKLHESQITTIPAIMESLGIEITVLQLINTNKESASSPSAQTPTTLQAEHNAPIDFHGMWLCNYHNNEHLWDFSFDFIDDSTPAIETILEQLNLSDELITQLKIAPYAYQRIESSLRNELNKRHKSGDQDFLLLLRFYYRIKLLSSFGLPYSKVASMPGANILKRMPGARVFNLPMPYQRFGYLKLKCSTKWSVPL